MDKVAYIIPGYPHSGREKPYGQIACFFKSRRITPVIVHMRWKHTTLSKNLNQLMRLYKKVESDKTYLLGFSVGAVIALIASAKIKIKTAILCSLSPVFKEDLPLWKKWMKKKFGKKRLEEHKKLSFNQLARKVNCKTVLVAGAKEHVELLRRVKAAKRKIKNSNLILIKGAHHDISQIGYLETLRKIISKI